MSLDIAQLRQSWPRPAKPRSIVIGAGTPIANAQQMMKLVEARYESDALGDADLELQE